MFIRAVTADDRQTWLSLAHESDEIVSTLLPDISTFYQGFDEYIESKISQNEAFMAVDGPSEKCLGIISFSRRNNRITFLGISSGADFHKTGSLLLDFALARLDTVKEISVKVLKSDSEQITKERNLYESFGFTEFDDNVFEAGVPAIEMKKSPQTKTTI